MFSESIVCVCLLYLWHLFVLGLGEALLVNYVLYQELLQKDGIHPSWEGARLLSQNLIHHIAQTYY